jgi:amino acid adenylation domain-containing protein
MIEVGHSLERKFKLQKPSGEIANLTPAQRSILELRLREKRAGASHERIKPRGRSSTKFPLSFAQQRLWFLDQLEPGSSFYNLPEGIRLRGSLDIAALEDALGAVIKRHEALRTTFSVSEGEPVQVVHEATEYRLPLIDLGQLEESEREAEVARVARAEASTPFDLVVGPLLRAQVLRLGEAEHVVLLTMHHIISDGWSMGVLVKEIAGLYEAIANGAKPVEAQAALEQLPIQYADYAVWQRESLRGAVLERQLSYWKEQLQDAAPVLELPTDKPRPLVQSFKGERESFELSADLSAGLRELSRTEGVTLFMTLLAAFQVLLWRYSGQADISIGTPVAGRTQLETEGLIGFFVNTLVLRTEVSGEESFRELLQRVREVALGGYSHQEVPFEKLVEELQPERELSRSPLFQVMFALQNMPREELALSELELSTMGVVGRTAKFDLTLTVMEQGGELMVTLEYNSELFEAETIRRLGAHYQVLLAGAVADPEQRVGRMELLAEEERWQLLHEWNATAVRYEKEELCVHELVEAQVARTPEAIALVYEQEQLSYGELNERANQLAHYLQREGVGVESLVGLLMERSVEMVVAMLAVLKAGAAYVPLDPAYPRERLSFMIADAAVELVLTQKSLQRHLSAPEGFRIINVESEWEQIAAQSSAAVASAVSADNLAYVIYTSGSTGTPKGVMISHRSLLNLVFWHQSFQQLSAGDRGTLVASPSFDASVMETWPYLSAGVALYLPPEETRVMPGKLRDWLLGQGITISFLPTPLAERVLAEEWPQAGAMRALLTGGDRLRDYPLGLGFEVSNHYGPTEVTVVTSCARLAGGPGVESGPPIGRPINNTEVYILDSELQPVPVGVRGELYIGGVGLARGYWQRPELTAERFIPDPFSGAAGGRLYRSGDLVRYLPDGNLEFLGRADTQVKVRGYRIELSEIEVVLGRHEGVRECAVLVSAGAASTKHLLAYVVPAAGTRVGSSELRSYLQQQLPEYMVPSTFVFLEELPLTANGKLDRRALLEMGAAYATPEHSYVAPRTAVEEILAHVWSQVLEVEAVGTETNFFELGGHSLLAMQLISRMREALQVELPLRSLFEAPTVAGLALMVEERLRSREQVETPPLRAVTRAAALPLSFAQQRLWFLSQLEPSSSFYNIAEGVRLSGALELWALRQSFSEIVSRHEALRTTFGVSDGEPVQVIHEATEFRLPLIDLGQLEESEREAEVERVARAEAREPFDLEIGPLLRVRVLRLGAAEHVVLLTMHHIISDGWSMGVLIKEIASLYTAIVSGTEPAAVLAPLPVQYADYAVWQRELSEVVLERQLSYWKEQLQGAAPVLELPTDKPRPAVQNFKGARERFEISTSLSAALKELSRGEGVTLFMTMLSAFQVLLWRYSGQADLSIGTPVAGRTQVETEGLIGFFVNTLVLRTEVRGAESFGELLKRVREVALGGYSHQEVPFEKLVEELQPERELSRSPLFQVMFVLQNMPGVELALSGLELSAMGVAGRTAKFDLTLTVVEHGGGLSGAIEYNSELFEAETIRRMGEHYRLLLATAVTEPEQRIGRMAMLAEAERRQLLEEWNATAVRYEGKDLCLHELVEAQVARTPEAIAVVYEQEQLSYRELNERANQLAHYLQREGVGAESLVGILMKRSVELVVALLAVLKAGAAYVPLDPAYPRERLRFMIEDAGVELVLTQESLQGRLVEQRGLRIVQLDREWEQIASESSAVVISAVDADNLAYVIYTSGSTGTPKGVAIQHRNTVTFLHWALQHFSPEQLSGVLASTSICFDISIFEIFAPLSCGGKIVLCDNALLLPALPSANQVTLINTVPSAMAELVRLGGIPSSVRTVNLAGEALKQSLVQEVYKQGHITQVFNLYGPSEDTTYSTYALVRGEERVTIGRPIANTQVYLLDGELQPVARGVAGELYLGGAGLARGYLHRPELTAERFIPDPFSGAAGRRLYRTGDLARYLPDGNLEYLGRADTQVKLRGYRIELGEIEAVLGSQPGVREAAVIIREGPEGDKRLVAYVVSEGGQQNVEDLRQALKEKLPDYMVPAAFVFLTSLPLTPNGKLDRRALPAPEPGSLAASAEFAAPRTVSEQVLATVWSELLGHEQVGLEDDFFALGGHSLLATQVVARVRTLLGVELPLRSLFGRMSLRELAGVVEHLRLQQAGVSIAPLRVMSRAGKLPLSFAQQRLWFLDQLEPGSSFYNLPEGIRLRGSLDIAALEDALGAVIKRHEALRTTFSVSEGEPVQVVHEATEFRLPLVDLGQLEESEREAEVARVARAEASTPFDLAVGPLLRAQVLRLGEAEHVVLLTMHHIISDGWSMGVLVKEIAGLYEAIANGAKPVEAQAALEQLPIQYADYAVWQREWLQGAVLERQLSYWKEQLQGAAPVLELPTDKPRPLVQSFKGATESLQLDGQLSAALKELSRTEGVTLFMTMLAAFQVLLWRYSGQADISIGTPVAGRTQLETEGLIGFFVNTLVLRTEVRGEESFRELLQRVREVALGGYSHQEVPFEKLVEELQPERELSRSPLFQVMFLLRNASKQDFEVSGLEFSSIGTGNTAAKFDLTLSLLDTGERLVGALEYNSDLFNASTIRRMVGCYEQLVKSIVANAEQQLSKVLLLPEGEREQVLETWNQTHREYEPAGSSLHELIEAQVARTPEAIAVVYEQEQLSYRELNERANQLAHYLQREGVGAETLVGILMERSVELVVAMLAVLKAGAAYVPLDPAYPRERLNFMIADAGVELVLTQESLENRLPDSLGRRILGLESEWEQIASESSAAVAGEVDADNLAYVIYTSGSTGTPKGVMVSHRSIVNHLHWRQSTYPLDASDRFLQKASFSFDISVWEIFGTLQSGARLVLARAGGQHDVDYLLNTVIDERITVLHFGTSMLQVFLDEERITRCESVRRVFCGGESLPVELQERFFANMRARLHHQYGPTEATVDVLVWDCDPDNKPGVVPIGRPIANTQVYILDSEGQPVPVGVSGEVYIAGESLARGYWGDAVQTAEKFIPNPFSHQPGARMYRSGDQGRFRPDGSVEFLGRLDQQVKIRGFRIELGEISAVLGQLPSVKQVFVMARTDFPDGDKRLVAYLVSEPETQLSVSELRSFVKERLPDYMMPHAFVFLDELPLTPNGKVNYRSLPLPDGSYPELEKSYAPPRTEAEEALVEIWEKVLGREKVGIYDSFFDQGGHSLLAIKLMARVQKRFQVQIPLRSFFQSPTVADLALTVVQSRAEQFESDEMLRILADLEDSPEEELQSRY